MEELRRLYEAACERVQAAADAVENAAEDADLEPLQAELDEAIAEADRCKANIDRREQLDRARANHPAPEPAEQPDTERARVRVGAEPLTYGEHAPERSFFSDAFMFTQRHDSAARERLERHGREQVDILHERGIQLRDVGTGAFDGLTVPQYLIDLFAPLARAGAPLIAGIPRKLQLPSSGMIVSISRATTGTAVAAQASENSAVQETDFDDTRLDVNVRTYAGQQDVSRQALERSEGVDAVIYADLVSDYFTKLDDAVINGAGTSGTHLGIRSTGSIIAVTYTDASPTLPEAYPKVADAIQQMAAQRYAPATTIVMHPRRWGWATSALDSSNRPLVVPNAQGPFNALAVGEAPEYGAVVGTMQGLPVITDANIPTNLGAGTNEDVILVERVSDLLLWWEGDGSPRRLSFEQTNPPQSVRLAVWGYSAFTAGRYPKSNATIGGTGLVTPTF